MRTQNGMQNRWPLPISPLLVSLVLGVALAAHAAHAQDGVGGPQVQLNLLNTVPDPARAGEMLTVHLQVVNTGSAEVDSMQVGIDDSYPFASTGDTQTLNIYPYQTDKNAANLEFKAKVDPDATSGTYQLKVRYKYSGGNWITTNFTVQVTNKEYAQIIYVDKSRLMPGQETPMNFTITNIGSAPLQNLVFSWNDDKGYILPVYSDNTKYVKYLDAGQSVTLTYIVVADVNAPPGLDQLNLALNYESADNATPSILKTQAGVLIGGETDFDVAFSESTQGQTSLSVANTGNNPASSVTVRIPDQENFRVLGSNSAIIGNLNKGDYTLVSFQIAPRGNATGEGQAGAQSGQRRFRSAGQGGQGNVTAGDPGSNMLNVVIDYTDTTGARKSIQKSVPIQFRSLSTGTGQFGGQQATQASIWQRPTLWVVVLVVVGVGGYYLFRRRKGSR